MKMKKLLLSVLIVLSLAIPSYATPMPISNRSDIGKSDNASVVGGGLCPSGVELIAVYFEIRGKSYIYVEGSNGRFIMADNAEGNNTPVWIGRVDKGSGAMLVERELMYKDVNGKSTCDFVAPEKA